MKDRDEPLRGTITYSCVHCEHRVTIPAAKWADPNTKGRIPWCLCEPMVAHVEHDPHETAA